MGRQLAEKLGYSPYELDRIPREAVDSFAGVGCHFSMAAIRPGEKVLDLGSGSGMDAFIAAFKTGKKGWVSGVDMTGSQLAKARKLAAEYRLENVSFIQGYIESLPVEKHVYDVVISNGVINLCADKGLVFAEIQRVLRPGGTLQFADIANGKPVPESAVRNIDLWTD